MEKGFEELKALGNKAFIENNFELAENIYTEALTQLESTKSEESTEEDTIRHRSSCAILLTNRAASRIQLEKYDLGLADASQAIEYDAEWVKAYYRKANALEKLDRHKEAYHTWIEASQNCEHSSWLSKQLKEAQARWKPLIYTTIIDSDDDFIMRYSILDDPRERLSMLAHFWNECTPDERLKLFFYFISLIGGQGELSDANKSISVEMMLPMPLHNYEDLPRERILLWCEYYQQKSSDDKLQFMRKIWESLSSIEQDAVVNDLKLFISSEMQAKLSQGTAGVEVDVDI
jgi:tetratricopeptide (TPR) repeat protein